jgi:alpha-tubulin suppressor-like RCC1 family protein
MRALKDGSLNLNVHAFTDDPLAISLEGGRPRLAVGDYMTLSAWSRPEAESWQWFLDGFPIEGETDETLTIAASLAEGNHVVTAAARKGDKAGTAEYWFRKTSFSSVRFLAFGSGYNAYGQLGIGTKTSQLSPVATNGLGTHSIEKVAAGAIHTLAYTKTGTLVAWGDNFMAQLGDGTVDERLLPVPVRDPPSGTVVKLGAGSYHSMVLLEDGSLWGWGANNLSQLGIGWAAEQAMPVRVKGLASRHIVDFVLGGDHCLALDSEGVLWAWGHNSDGQLGDGTTLDRDMPGRVMGMDGRNIIALAAGYASSAVVLSDGSVFAWGDNAKGQLGDGTTTDRKLPVSINALAGKKIQALSLGGCGLGGGHSLALSSDGGLWAWGDNAYGQLGIGSTTASTSPIAVTLPTGTKVRKIASGGFHSLALMTNGSVWGWGRGNNGQLGTGSSTNKNSPTLMNTPQGSVIVDISCGELFSYLLKSEDVL